MTNARPLSRRGKLRGRLQPDGHHIGTAAGTPSPMDEIRTPAGTRIGSGVALAFVEK